MKDGRRLDVALLIMRIGLGLIILFFGSQKALGVFGGMGYAATVAGISGQGFHPVLANLAIAAEFLGGLGVLLGLLTPVAAFGIACTMAVATYTHATQAQALQEMFTSGKDANVILFPAAIFFLAVGVMILGAGRFSIDHRLFGKRKAR